MILDLFCLDGRKALVTGAAKGLGRAFALALAEAGADVAVADILDPVSTAEEIRALDRKAVSLQVDLAGEEACADLVARAEAAMGRIDILVNNAGIIRRAPLLDFPRQDWDDVIRINQTALFLLSQAAARGMVERGFGRIINVASMLSFQGGIRVPSYTASKSAVKGLTLAMANELADKGITVNAIAPGYMATDNTAALRADEGRNQAILDRIPAARWGTPEDLQGACVFLASDAASYVNGAILNVDGGWLAR